MSFSKWQCMGKNYFNFQISFKMSESHKNFNEVVKHHVYTYYSINILFPDDPTRNEKNIYQRLG